jgi:hypothetical protein
MDTLSALALPDGGDRTGTIERKSNAKDADSLAWKFVGVQVVILATAVAWCHGWNHHNWGWVCYLPSMFIFVVVWATTLDRRCSLWPFRLSIVAAYATPLQGFYSSHFNFVVVPAASPFGYGHLVFWTLLCFVMLAPLYYKASLMFRRCLQTQYSADGAMLNASRNMMNQLLAAAPVLLVFILEASTALSGYTASIEEYAAHTPYCVHTPDDLGEYNTAFRCTQDPAYPFEAPGLENADHILGHLSSGIATLRLFLSPTTYSPFHNATARAATLARSPPVTDDTAVLMMHDFKRFLAVADYEDNLIAFVVAFTQGVVFIATLVASQVLVRGSRSTMDDLLQSRVTKAEIGAVACTGLNVLLVMVAGSLRAIEYGTGGAVLRVAIIGVLLVQMACLYKLCKDIITGHHKFHSVRAHRPSTTAVVPHPPETAAGATEAASTVEISPATSLPSSAQDGVLAMMEGFKRELEEQKGTTNDQKRASDEQIADLRKALEEQTSTTNEQKRASDEQVADLRKALEEQKRITDEMATGLRQALVDQASLRKALEQQRPPIDRNLENSLKEQGPLERVSSEAPAVKLGGMQELKSKARSKTFKLSSIDRNLESSLQEQGIDISR